MKKTVLVGLAAFSSLALAEPMMLECKTTVSSTLADAATKVTNLEKNHKHYKRNLQREEENKRNVEEQCKGFTDYGHLYSVNFDTEGLKNSSMSGTDVKMAFTCKSASLYSGTIHHSPNYISFTSSHSKRVFTVNRKTLKGGFEADSGYSCEIKVLDTSSYSL
jgi:hypothetical protein